MDRREISALLALIAARDGRTVGAVEVEAWSEDVGRWDFATAREAVRRHNARSREFLRPFDLVKLIREIRSERLLAAGEITPPAELADDPPGEIAWLRARREAVASGRHHLPAGEPLRLVAKSPHLLREIRALAASIVVPERRAETEAGREQPQPEVSPDDAAAMEAERRRQMSALELLDQN